MPRQTPLIAAESIENSYNFAYICVSRASMISRTTGCRTTQVSRPQKLNPVPSRKLRAAKKAVCQSFQRNMKFLVGLLLCNFSNGWTNEVVS